MTNPKLLLSIASLAGAVGCSCIVTRFPVGTIVDKNRSFTKDEVFTNFTWGAGITAGACSTWLLYLNPASRKVVISALSQTATRVPKRAPSLLRENQNETNRIINAILSGKFYIAAFGSMISAGFMFPVGTISKSKTDLQTAPKDFLFNATWGALAGNFLGSAIVAGIGMHPSTRQASKKIAKEMLKKATKPRQSKQTMPPRMRPS